MSDFTAIARWTALLIIMVASIWSLRVIQHIDQTLTNMAVQGQRS